MRMQTILPALGALALAMAGCSSTASQRDIMESSSAIIIDVRTQQEYEAGHLEGALHMPYDVIQELIPAKVASKNAKVLLYCRSGNRSGKALKTIQAMGYTQAENIGAMPEAAETTGRKIVK